MNPQDIGTLIDKLAAKLSVPAAQLWGILVKQAGIDAIKSVAWTVFFAVVVWAILGHGRRQVHAWAEEEPAAAPLWLFWGLMLIASIAMVGWNVSHALNGYLNPEFVALQYILDAAR